MINSSYFWQIIFLLALGTIGIRLSIIAISSRVQISSRVKELFSFIPAAILPAILAPMVFFHSGQVDWIFGKERLFILVLATVVCYFTRSMVMTIGFGLISLYLITQF